MLTNRPMLLSLATWLMVFTASAATPPVPTAHKCGDTVIEHGSSVTATGDAVAFELGTLYVSENRLRPTSRIIGVGFVRMRALTPSNAPPIFILPGGPGGSLLGAFTGVDARSQRQLTNLAKYRAAADVVIIDQRGFSRRGDVLELPAPRSAPDVVRSDAADVAELAALARSAVAANMDKDLAGYTIVQCAEDVNELRVALGYDRISLLGQSYGSQWSFAVMRLHPEIVSRAQLSGVEPLDYGYDMPSHVFAALERVAWDADRDPALLPYLPSGGVLAAMRAVHERLTTAPKVVAVRSGNVTKSVRLSVQDFEDAQLQEAASWPAFVLTIYHGHYDEWAASVLAQREAPSEPVALIAPLIDTSLGVTGEREQMLRNDPATALLGVSNFHSYIATAEDWPTPDVGDDLRVAVQTAIPVLFLQGDWDVSTPVENTLNMLPYFPNSRAILVHRGTHGARTAVFDQQPDILALVLDFLRSGDFRSVPARISLPTPKFQKPSFDAPVAPARETQATGKRGG